MATVFPASAIVPTRNRSVALSNTFQSLAGQSYQPKEIVVVDASDGDETEELCQTEIDGLESAIKYYRAATRGAASQRNEAFEYSSESILFLMDDDILFDEGCLEKMFHALEADPKCGGVNAMIKNQQYSPPGKLSGLIWPLMLGEKRSTYAGLCMGPVVNLLPEDRDDLPEVVDVEWMNTTCVLYRREALPNPPFSSHFKGYSLMEDVSLSVTVAKKWRIANVRTARIFHDSQPGDHKSSHAVLSEMELVNRKFVMTEILGRRAISDYLKMALYEAYRLLILFGRTSTWPQIIPSLWGKIRGAFKLMAS